MVNIRLERKLEKRLERLANLSGRSMSYHANRAIREYIQDLTDYSLGIAAMERDEPRVSLDHLERELGLSRYE
jgi:RHH-type rel operon transcriptional repressor/antitoxin RelB